jgi:hypothetical protein
MATTGVARFEVHLPPPQSTDTVDQDEEWCEVEVDGERRRIRLHDYAAIYDIPGLYEHLFSEMLDCSSPDVVCGLLSEQIDQAAVDPAALTALDFGAGGGMIGERLSRMGVGTRIGVDLLPEARTAALRDRPGSYDEYRVLDFTALSAADRAELERRNFNCLTCVAALGFDDVPLAAFVQAFNLIACPGWLAFNLRGRFLEEDDATGFGAFIKRMLAAGIIEQRARRRYIHRISVSGEPLDYVAIIATKRQHVPLSWVA